RRLRVLRARDRRRRRHADTPALGHARLGEAARVAGRARHDPADDARPAALGSVAVPPAVAAVRCFVAVDLPDDVRGAVAALQADARAAAPRADVAWVDATKLHLTLKFLGEVEDD